MKRIALALVMLGLAGGALACGMFAAAAAGDMMHQCGQSVGQGADCSDARAVGIIGALLALVLAGLAYSIGRRLGPWHGYTERSG